jgi:hypothetical protein
MRLPHPRSRTLVRSVVAAMATFVVVVGLPVSAQASAGDFVAAINGARANAGLPGLAVAGDLAAVAQGQAQRMAASGTLYHNPNLATEVKNYRLAGENVGYGPSTSAIHAAFMASPPHRANILNTHYTQVGVGVVVDGGGVTWVAEVFRQPLSAPAPAPVAPAPVPKATPKPVPPPAPKPVAPTPKPVVPVAQAAPAPPPAAPAAPPVSQPAADAVPVAAASPPAAPSELDVNRARYLAKDSLETPHPSTTTDRVQAVANARPHPDGSSGLLVGLAAIGLAALISVGLATRVSLARR